MAREKLRLLVAIRDLLDRVVHDAKLNLLRVEDEHYAQVQSDGVLDGPD